MDIFKNQAQIKDEILHYVATSFLRLTSGVNSKPGDGLDLSLIICWQTLKLSFCLCSNTKMLSFINERGQNKYELMKSKACSLARPILGKNGDSSSTLKWPYRTIIIMLLYRPWLYYYY